MANLLTKHLRRPTRLGPADTYTGAAASARERERDDDEFMVLIKRALPIGRFAALRPPGQKVAAMRCGPSCITLSWTDGRCRAATTMTTLEHHTGFMALLQKVNVPRWIQEG